MFVELASLLSLVDLVVVGDALVRVAGIPPDDLVRACEASTDQHAAAALQAARYVRAGVDSPMETRLRMLIVLAGLPEPKVNHVLRDDFGNVRRRFDLCYPELRLIVEYDGRHHIEREASWESDLDRREELDEGEWRILVVTAKGIYRHPARTLARVHRALRSRGGRTVPSRLKDDWRAHFPGRP
jgi:very-short-patch-repair endonuclease